MTTKQSAMYSTKPMSWDKENNRLVVDVTDLDDGINFVPAEVIWVKSHKTGVEIPFSYTQQLINGRGEDAEIGGWIYHPMTEAKVSYLVIFND